ncbi:hypothetical protein vBPpSSYP_27 [Pseudomonas phage vB_PpS_SYP]|nr:hypothetical protein vBPpSSYP_27 [Pseudomonas phage vB_PpS_SYP]
MKALTNQRDLLSVYNKGDLSRVAKDLNLYQSIETDKEWEDVEGMPMRKKTYLVKHSKGVSRWTVKMKRGDVVSVSCEFEAK